MQFTDERVNKRFQANRFLYCVIIGYEKNPAQSVAIIENKYGCDRLP